MDNLVAVYGSLRKSLHNHRLLEEATFVGKDKINGFSMYSYGGFPFIRPDGSEDKIHIEVYSVTPQEFNNLDRLEGYPNFYDRKQVETKYGNAWIYFIDQEGTGYPKVESGDWLQYVLEEKKHGY